MTEQIAEAFGIDPAAKYTERDAAQLLAISPATLGNHRRCGLVTHYKLGGRVYYTGHNLIEYVEAQRCPATQTTDATKLGTGGSAEKPARPPGIDAGTTRRPNKQSALVYARQILKLPAARSTSGSLNPTNQNTNPSIT